MLKDFVKAEKPQDEELKQRIREAGEKLAAQQNQIKEHKIPVLVLMEGWGTAGKGSLIGEVIKYLDPRFFKVAAMNVPTEEEKRKPFLYRYFQKIPEAGKFMFLDTGWMDEITRQRLNGEMDDKVYEQRLESVRNFERQLTDNGYVVLKNLRHDNIVRKEDGKQWIVLNRQKTGSTSYIPLLDIPLRLIEKYWDTAFAGFGGRVFRLCTIENADIQLKKIAKEAKIEKRLTYHMARHSYATLCLSMGVPIETISQTLGHRSISTTQIYADITRTKINEDMTNLAERIEGRYEFSKLNY